MHRFPQDGDREQTRERHVDRRPYARHREEGNAEDDQGDENRGTEIRLDRDQPDRHDDHGEAEQERLGLVASGLAVLKDLGEDEDHHHLDELGRLDAHIAEEQPAMFNEPTVVCT